MSGVFGDMFVVSDLEVDALATLQKWFSTYLREIERRQTLDPYTIQDPKTYNSRNTTELLPGELLPKCVVISPGTTGRPIHDGAGRYRAIWQLAVAVAFSDEDEETAKLKVSSYAAAIRAMMLNKLTSESSLKIVEVIWVGESSEDLPIPNRIQLLKASIVSFTVDIQNIASRRGGPDEPTDDSSVYGTAQTVGVTILKEPLDA